MGLGRLLEAWNNYGIQMLVLMSFVLQLLLFILPIVRRHKMLEKRKYLERLLKLLLWLAYQVADTTAIYVLGHMAIISSSHLSGEVMALWASLLLVHLGGQDTMTAYSLEDNRLWKRHLLTLLVQTAGVLYVLLGYEGGGRSSGPYPHLRAASALMFVAGFLKFAERIKVLRSSDMYKLFRRVGEPYRDGVYTAPSGQDSSERAEEDLKQAHELLYLCMWQFMDDKADSSYQKTVIEYYAGEKRLLGLVHLQLSLMHDLLYTKAVAIHTRCGFLLRVFSWLATATTCTLVFLYGTGSSTDGVRRLDAAVTYALVAGAFLLETASSLGAAGSTWTCEILRSRGWDGLGRVVLAFRRLVRAAEWSRRRCPGYIGGRVSVNWVFAINRAFAYYCNDGEWWSAYGQKDPNTSLFVDEIKQMVTAYIEMDGVVDHTEKEKEKLMNSRGGLSLGKLLLSDGGKVKLTQDLEQLEFDEYLVLWYHATFDLTFCLPLSSSSILKHAVQDLARYMMYLFKKQPHMLPPPVREHVGQEVFRTGSVYYNLVDELRLGDDVQKERNLKALLWVWIEMLCYAASHCNRESHVRELSNGSPELATVLWIVRGALIYANMKPAVSTADAASVGPVATEGNNVITHRPSSVPPPVPDTNLIGNHRRVASV